MIKPELKKVILKACADYEIKSADIDVEKPKNSKFGDFATSIALKIAKEHEDKNSQRIARDIAQKIESEIIEKVEVAGPGFINFYLSRSFVRNQIEEIIDQCDDFGVSKTGAGKKIQVEFISANPTGPLTLGNGRGGFMGDTLARVLEASGYQVNREYYLNDTGNQIAELGKSVLGQDGAYRGKYIDELAGKIKTKEISAAGREAAGLILEKFIKPSVKKMGIEFDNYFSESQLYEEGKVIRAIEELKVHDLIYGKEGALWFRAHQLGDDKDRVLKRKDGQFTYFASDIAYHLDKFNRGFDKVIDFWGADHYGYVKRLKLALEALGYKNQLEVIIAQLVRLVKDGKEVKMSKRAGTYVTLDELIDEVGLDVARFFFLMNAAGTHMDFDLALAKEKSQKNPVYYVQYAYARIQSILSKSKVQNPKFKISEADLSKIKEKEEIDLIKKMIEFPDLVAEISKNYQVQGLPFYAIELADSFHKFYEKHQVISKDIKLTGARLALVSACAQVLKNCLGLMGISAPEKM